MQVKLEKDCTDNFRHAVKYHHLKACVCIFSQLLNFPKRIFPFKRKGANVLIAYRIAVRKSERLLAVPSQKAVQQTLHAAIFANSTFVNNSSLKKGQLCSRFCPRIFSPGGEGLIQLQFSPSWDSQNVHHTSRHAKSLLLTEPVTWPISLKSTCHSHSSTRSNSVEDLPSLHTHPHRTFPPFSIKIQCFNHNQCME